MLSLSKFYGIFWSNGTNDSKTYMKRQKALNCQRKKKAKGIMCHDFKVHYKAITSKQYDSGIKKQINNNEKYQT